MSTAYSSKHNALNVSLYVCFECIWLVETTSISHGGFWRSTLVKWDISHVSWAVIMYSVMRIWLFCFGTWINARLSAGSTFLDAQFGNSLGYSTSHTAHVLNLSDELNETQREQNSIIQTQISQILLPSEKQIRVLRSRNIKAYFKQLLIFINPRITVIL